MFFDAAPLLNAITDLTRLGYWVSFDSLHDRDLSVWVCRKGWTFLTGVEGETKFRFTIDGRMLAIEQWDSDAMRGRGVSEASGHLLRWLTELVIRFSAQQPNVRNLMSIKAQKDFRDLENTTVRALQRHELEQYQPPNLPPVTIKTPIGNGKFKFQEISQEEFAARCQTLEDGTLYYIPPKEPTNMNQDQGVQPHWPPLPYLNPKDNTRDKRVAQQEDDKARAIFITNLLGMGTLPPHGNQARPFEQELMREAIDMVLIIIGKNRDYGASVAKPPLLAPHLPAGVGIDVRLSDKIERLISLSNGSIANVKDESIEDTKLDMAAYVLLQRVVRKMQPQQGQSCPTPSNATSVEKT